MPDIWLAFLPHSHIDGGRFTPNGARGRLARTRGRASFVTYGSEDGSRNENPKGVAILRELKFPVMEREIVGLEHTDLWIEKDSPARPVMRDWIANLLRTRLGTRAVRGSAVDSDGRGIAGIRVRRGHWSITGADGHYMIRSLVPGRGILAPAKPGLTFVPAEQEIAIATEDVNAEGFTEQPAIG